MRRVTKAEQLQQENEAEALDFFKTVLGGLPDARRAQGLRYPLESVVVIALMAMVCSCDDAQAMEFWGEANRDWLEGFLELPHGSPTQDVFLAVFASLDPQAFSRVFRAWAQLLAVRLRAKGKHIALDGKTSRRSFDAASDKTPLHMVNAWLVDAGLVLGQRKTADKSNEITAMPELLQLLDLRGVTVSTDAMGCQVSNATTIVNGGGHYLFAVKENQPKLYEDIVKTFAEAADPRRRSGDELPRPAFEMFSETDKGHGRVEERTLNLCRDLSWLTAPERWPSLAFVAEVIRERTELATNKTSVEIAYYIGSDATADAQRVATTIRRHWGVENELHWVLDMAFREDEARHRAGNTAQNMTLLRHFAINIIKQDKKRKGGVANSRKRAGWDRNYLLRLLISAKV